MLMTTRREMERAFRTHSVQCNAGSSGSHRLLLVYAAECGLKALIMQNARADDTRKLPQGGFNHDLREGLKQVRAPGILTVRGTITRQRTPQTVVPQNLHLAFRYGVHVEDEPGVVADLTAVILWLQERVA